MELQFTGNKKRNATSLLLCQYIGLLVSHFTMDVEKGLFIFYSYDNNWLTESLYLLMVTFALSNILIIPFFLGWFIDDYIKYKYNLKKIDLFQMLLTVPVIFYIAINYPSYISENNIF